VPAGGRASAAAAVVVEVDVEDDKKKEDKAKGWRTEAAEEEDERDFSDDDAATERKLAESRRRREAMMKEKKEAMMKFCNEEKKEGDDDDAVLARTTSKVDGAEDGGDAPAAGGKAEVKEVDEATRAKKREVQNFVVQAKKEEEAAGDMFDILNDAKALKGGKAGQAAAIGVTGASGDDWDDGEGYYIAKVGEVLEDRYSIYETLAGRGVFSNVVKAKDKKERNEDGHHPNVAIKIIRSNDMMKKAAEKEVEILQLLNSQDKKNQKHVVRLLDTFYYRKHIFLVFECMWDDLRAAVKKYTKNKGMTLTAVKAYSKQLLIGVRHMHKCNIVHADLKPDNILISESNNIVKLCDFGTAIDLKDITISPYLMSRFYRPPEVILGCEYGIAVDVWALACTLAEIFTGKTLLMGKTNNDQLKRIMDLKGKIPVKVIKKGFVWKQHFDDNLDFKYEDKDKLTGEPVMRILTDNNAKRDMKEICLERVGKEKTQSQDQDDQRYVKSSIHYADLLDKMLSLNPENRLTAEDALKHHFLADHVPPNSKGTSDKRR